MIVRSVGVTMTASHSEQVAFSTPWAMSSAAKHAWTRVKCFTAELWHNTGKRSDLITIERQTSVTGSRCIVCGGESWAKHAVSSIRPLKCGTQRKAFIETKSQGRRS